MRWVLRILGGLLLLFVLAVGGIAFYLNEIVSRAIEEGGTRSLGVRTAVSGVWLRPVTGKARIFGLEIANPPGFDSPHFLTLGDGFVKLDVDTLRQDPIEITQIRLETIELDLEQRGGKMNTDAILDHMGSADTKTDTEPASGEQSGPSVVVRELLIRDITAFVDLVESMGKYGRMEVKIPEIRLTNLGAAEEGGADMSEVTDIIVSALLSAVAKHGAGLPLELTKDLVAGLGNLGNVSYQVVGNVTGGVVDASGKAIESTTKGLTDVAAGAAKGAAASSKSAADSVKTASDAIGGLLGSKDDSED